MYNWNLPDVNSSLNVWGRAIWQHTIFTVYTDRIVWSIKCSRSAAFLKIHLCENKRKRSLVRIPSVFSNVFVWVGDSLRPIIEHRNLHPSRQLSRLFGDVILHSDWLPKLLPRAETSRFNVLRYGAESRKASESIKIGNAGIKIRDACIKIGKSNR